MASTNNRSFKPRQGTPRSQGGSGSPANQFSSPATKHATFINPFSSHVSQEQEGKRAVRRRCPLSIFEQDDKCRARRRLWDDEECAPDDTGHCARGYDTHGETCGAQAAAAAAASRIQVAARRMRAARLIQGLRNAIALQAVVRLQAGARRLLTTRLVLRANLHELLTEVVDGRAADSRRDQERAFRILQRAWRGVRSMRCFSKAGWTRAPTAVRTRGTRVLDAGTGVAMAAEAVSAAVAV